MPTELTAQQYATFREINVSHVKRYCANNKPLTYVESVRKVGRQYILSMSKEYDEKIVKEKFGGGNDTT